MRRINRRIHCNDIWAKCRRWLSPSRKTSTSSIFADPTGSHYGWKLCLSIARGRCVQSFSASVSVYSHSSWGSWFTAILDRYSSINTMNFERHISFFIFYSFFAQIYDHWGSKKIFIAGIASAISVFVMFPVANTLAQTQGFSLAVWTAIEIQTIAGILLGLSFDQFFLYNLQTVFIFWQVDV